MSERGRYIALEGGEGGGKSTQAKTLAARLDAVLTREPGGTQLGIRVRELVLDPALAPVDARAEALLMAADRAQHIAQVVKPALDAGRHVVSDRSAYSSLAYQGFGRGLALEEICRISRWATAGVWPDLVLVLDVPLEVAAQRVRRRRGTDRLEQEQAAFHERVRAGFHELAAADPARVVLVDATPPLAEVAISLANAVHERLGL